MATRAKPRKDRALRNPIDLLTHGLPRQWRIAIDWAITILGAIAIVLAIKAYVVNPYRIPSSSMEPTLHCARPGSGCESRWSDRVLANRFIYHFRDPKRGEIVVFKTPPAAEVACNSGGSGSGGETFVKRLIALPGDRWREQAGYIYLNGKKLNEPYVKADRRDTETIPEKTVPSGQYLMLGDNRASSCDSRRWGTVPREEPDRAGVRDLLAARAHRLQVGGGGWGGIARRQGAMVVPRPRTQGVPVVTTTGATEDPVSGRAARPGGSVHAAPIPAVIG